MKKYIFVLVALIAGAIVYFVLKSQENNLSRPSGPVVETLSEQGKETDGSDDGLADSDDVPVDSRRTSALAPYEEFRPSGMSDVQWEKIVYQYLLGKKSNGKINFYGKVVDTDGIPLSGVAIKVHIDRNEEDLVKVLERQTVRAPDRIYEISSQQDGGFEITKEVGTELIFLEFTKKGYSLEGRSWFSYEAEPESVNLGEFGEAGNPIIFRMVPR